MPVKALTAEWSVGKNRPINEEHVKGLVNIFRRGGVKRSEARNHLLVLSTRSDVEAVLRATGHGNAAGSRAETPSFDCWLSVNHNQVEILAGQHRVEALKRHVKESGVGDEELWWPCEFYDGGG